MMQMLDIWHGCAQVKQFRVRKHTIFRDFKAQVAQELGVPEDAQVWWKWSERVNKSYRVAGRLSEVEEAQKVADIREQKSNKHLQMPLNLYLQVCCFCAAATFCHLLMTESEHPEDETLMKMST